MNAPVNQSLLLSSVAAEHIARCRALLAGEEMTGEQLVLSNWWNGMKRIERYAFFCLAGINNYNTKKAWMELPEKQRAALVLTAGKWVEGMQGVLTTLKETREKAQAMLEQEARKSMLPRVKAKAA